MKQPCVIVLLMSRPTGLTEIIFGRFFAVLALLCTGTILWSGSLQ